MPLASAPFNAEVLKPCPMTLVSSRAPSWRAISAAILASSSLAAGERHAETIAHGDFCGLHRLARYGFVVKIGHELGQFCGDVHVFLRLIA